MAFSQDLNLNILEQHNRVLYLPASWNRLMSLIKYQIPNGGFAVMEGEFGAGKSSFGKIFEKKLVPEDAIGCQFIQVHPLSTIQQIRSQLPKQLDKPMMVIIDDAHEASTLLLQKLTAPLDNIYWLLLAEPGIGDRVDAFAERRVDLPLFSKDDCFGFLQKQLQDQPKYAQVTRMQSDTIWYSSEGLPKDIVHYAQKSLSSWFTGQESSENFEKANKSWYMTAALAVAALVLIVVLAINMGTEEPAKEVVAEQLPAQELVIEPSPPAQPEPAPVAEQVTEQAPDSEAVAEPSSATVSSITEAKAKTSQPLSEQELREAAGTSDPIETIALQVAKKETSVEAQTERTQDFSSWLNSHSRDAYSLQLFSHSDKAAAQSFKDSLDLANSYVYSAEIEGKKHYRVLWGAFSTRAEASQAIESLPPKILAQKPWIRQFAAIAREVSQ